jgi:hypothetical protein
MDNLWPEIGEIAKKRTPIVILNEQGSLLAERTEGVIVGETKRSKGLEDKYTGIGKLTGNIFVYNFILRAPFLQYTYKLFTIAYDIFSYPTYFINIEDDIGQEVRGQIGPEIIADNEDEYMRILRIIFNTKKTKKIISSILSQLD